MDPGKVREVLDWKPPRTVDQVCSFVSLAGYYRIFIPNFSKIAKPIIDLLKKEEKFVWNAECDEVFQTLKKLLITSPVLAQWTLQSPSMFIMMHRAWDLAVFSCNKVT
jgi:hypothetical protein